MHYQYKGKYIDLQINAAGSPTSLNIIPHGNKIDTVKAFNDTILVQVFELESEVEGDNPSFVAQWTYNNVGYQFSGKMEKKEFVEIIHKCKY